MSRESLPSSPDNTQHSPVHRRTMQSPPGVDTFASPGQQQHAGAGACPGSNADPECALLLKSLGYGQHFVRAGDTALLRPPRRDTDKAPIVLIEGLPVASLPVTLQSPTTSQPVHKLRDMFKRIGRKYGDRIPVRRDPYVDSDDVAALHAKTFKQFIKFLDASFVLFYNPFDDKCRLAKYNIRKAASCTRRENHGYAAVDCTKECELCLKHGVKTFPTMQLFSRGTLVNTFTDDPVLLSSDIQTFVETCPIMESTSRAEKCSIQ